jgi:ClpP class serine protease
MTAFDAALGTPWAIRPDVLEQILAIAAREHEVTPEALEAYRAESVARADTLEQRGSVAILTATGPLFRRANLFTEFSGATSYDILRRDLQVALDNRDVRSILLNIDSPGGAVNGCGELAKAIYAAEKPVVAYVGGTGASAAYWLASAARQVVVDDSAELGSIGVLLGITDTREQDRARGVRDIEFVSSQSPMKNPDPDLPEGAASYQKRADDLAAVFIAAVAKHRGMMPAEVTAEFGQGGVFVGADAVAAGMADSVGTFEDTLARLSREQDIPRAPAVKDRRRAALDEPAAEPAAPHSRSKEKLMADEQQAGEQPAAPTVDVDAERKAAVAADRKRRSEIMGLDEAQGREALAEHLYGSTDMSVEAIRATLAAAPRADAPEPDPAADYDAQRTATAGAGLGDAPKGERPKAKIDRSEIYAARRAGTQE